MIFLKPGLVLNRRLHLKAWMIFQVKTKFHRQQDPDPRVAQDKVLGWGDENQPKMLAFYPHYLVPKISSINFK